MIGKYVLHVFFYAVFHLILCIGPASVPAVVSASVMDQIAVRKTGPRNAPVVYVSNRSFAPVEVEFQLTRAENVLAAPPLPARFVIPPQSEQPTFTLRPRQATGVFSYAYRYSAVYGDSRAQHRPDAPYLPPFQRGGRFRISKAFSEAAAHQDPLNAFSVNILIPGKTPVRAARGGVVATVSSESFQIQTNRGNQYLSSDLIKILHDDGTFGVYARLLGKSARQGPGSRVRAGDIIALAGNLSADGFPSLYFSVQKNTGMRLVSVPFTFDNGSGGGVKPSKGMILNATR